MTLKELYNLKLYEYKNTGFITNPNNLLAMLLLSDIDKYQEKDLGERAFYKLYKNDIDIAINKVENDFNITYKNINLFSNDIQITQENYDIKKKIIFELGIYSLYWGLIFYKDKTPEEIYIKLFDTYELEKEYSIEEKAIANNIKITKIDELINKIVDNPDTFYNKISENLTVEERLFIIKNLENKSCLTCTNGSCKVQSYEKTGCDEEGNLNGHNCLGWNNNNLIGKCKVRKITDINKLIHNKQ